MKLYPYEDSDIYAFSKVSLGLSERARVVNIFKDYDWYVDTIKNDNRKKATKYNNDEISKKLVFFGISIISCDNIEIDISGFTPIDVDKLDKEERLRKQQAEDNGDFDYREQFNFR